MSKNIFIKCTAKASLQRFAKRAIALTVLLTTGFASAQPWYQVELILFKQDFPELAAQGTTPETWPQEVELSYPDKLLTMFESESELTPAMRKLAINDRNMNGDSYAFRVTDGYELLWHQAWQQPLIEEEEAPWILIQGGDEVDGHFELEGALRMHLSRFLHVTADLWLTDFNFPAGDPVFYLSQLPETPEIYSPCSHFRFQQAEVHINPNADILAEPPTYESWWLPPYGCELARHELLEGKPLYAPLSPLAAPEVQEVSYFTVPREYSFLDMMEAVESTQTTTDLSLPSTDNAAAIDENGQTNLQIPMPRVRIGQPEAPYLPMPEISLSTEDRAVSEIVHIEMNRRMRSEEFHFIDHPKMGMLIRVIEVPAPVIALDSESFAP